jgi:hypothetical protein
MSHAGRILGGAMKPNEAAEIFERFHAEGLPDRVKELEDAKRILRRHFAETGKKLYRRSIACQRRKSKRFSQELAVEMGYLTPDQIEAAKVETEVLVLSYVGPDE